jgi:hypothetical protein
MFWPADDLSKYEIGGEPIYSYVRYAKRSNERLPYLVAEHDFYEPKKGNINARGEPERRTGRQWYSPRLHGEADGDRRGERCHIETWAYVGHSHKRRVAEVNQEIVLKKPRERDIRQYLKPDSKLVLLFWARQIIAWHYIKYWMQPLKQAV